MGNYRFKLSDMMPNAWFYKLRDMNSKSKNHNSSTNTIKKKLPTLIQNPRKSYYHTTADKLVCSPKNPKAIDTHFPNPDPPRKSSKKKTKRKTIYKPSPRQTPPVPVWLKPENAHFQDYSDSTDDNLSPPEHDLLESPSYSDCFDINQKSLDQGIPPWSSSCSCKLSSSPTDIIIDMEKTSYNSIKIESCSEFNMISEPGPILPPILTKPSKLLIDDPEKSTQWRNLSTKITRDQNRTNPTRNTRRSGTSPASRKSISRHGRVKIGGRLSKPAAGAKKAECQSEKKNGLFYSESFAIVKASFDPEQDFRDSMMEMIVENNIRASKDLEDLLACYLSLNSNQYHELIIKAFEQIWFDMPHR